MIVKEFIKDKKSIAYICSLLAKGEVVALPTETAYGLAADATKPQAVAKVSRLKGRQSDKPVALLAADLKMVKKFFKPTNLEIKLMKKFWPGPLTILLKPKYKFSKLIIGKSYLVGVRVPGDKWLRQLLLSFGKPLTATSANISGQPAAYTARAVKKSLTGQGLKYVIDGGRLPRRATSTVVKIKLGNVEIIRPGAISYKKIRDVIS